MKIGKDKKRSITRVVAAALTASMLAVTMAGCGSQIKYDDNIETVIFTDSCGREVEVPADITRVAPSGSVATMFLETVCPDYMVSVSSTPSSSQYKFFDESIIKLPTTGQLYGSKSTINLESLLAAQPQVIIDLGDRQSSIKSDMNSLQKQTSIPTVFIEGDLNHMAEAFRMLGTLLNGKEERCEELAEYVEETVSLANETRALIPEEEKRSVCYTTGTAGLNTNAKGSTQAQVLDLIGAENAVVVDDISNKGGGNTINMEQLYLFDPDVIVFTTGSMYDKAAEDAEWQKLDAVSSGEYYEIPCLPYNWLSGPPSINMLLGIRWLGNLIYPEYYQLDEAEEAKRAYKLLWNYDLTDEEVTEMLSRSTLKK